MTTGKITTKMKILDAAVFVLANSGLAGFTISKVARKANISQGNLTYYYKNKDLLIESMIDHWFCEWKSQYEVKISFNIETLPNDIEKFIDWVMDGALDEKNVRIFTELWALSNKNKHVSEILDQLYESAVQHVIFCLGIQKEDSIYKEIYDLLYFLAAASEGSSAILGNSAPDHPQRVIIKTTAKKILLPSLLKILAPKRLD